MDPTTGETLWSRRDHRVKPNDMFVALEVANNHLFWCTNHGYFGFMSLAEANNTHTARSFSSGQDLGEELVSFHLKHNTEIFCRSWKVQYKKQGAIHASLESSLLGAKR